VLLEAGNSQLSQRLDTVATPKKRPGRPAVEELTGPQQRTLEELRRIIAREKLPPTMQELAVALGVTAASVHEQVSQLVRKGFIKREPRKARNLTIVDGPVEEVAELVEIPIVGTVAAGLPVLAEENIVGQVIIEGSLARRGRCFALQVVGDSMIRAGIKAQSRRGAPHGSQQSQQVNFLSSERGLSQKPIDKRQRTTGALP
jgi:DNA-binding transcriptional MocR family regulator